MANFPCSFHFCKESFQTEDELRQHKATKSDHAYCLICDHDFPDAASVRMHVVQRHPQAQELHCPGCDEVFHRFASLIGHWEGNSCENPNYSAAKLHERREEQLDFAAKLRSQSPDLEFPQPSASAHGSSSNSIEATCANYDRDADLSLWNPGDFPLPAITQYHQDGSKTIDWLTGSITEDPASDDDPWASIELATTPKSPVRDERLLDSMHCSEQGPEREESGLPIHHPDHPEFNAERYWDEALRWYTCPHGCKGKKNRYQTAAGLVSHLRSVSHSRQKIRCPSCFKRFRSAFALAQHVESASARCRIRSSGNHNFVVNELSAGFIKTDGYHLDSTPRYSTSNRAGLKPDVSLGPITEASFGPDQCIRKEKAQEARTWNGPVDRW